MAFSIYRFSKVSTSLNTGAISTKIAPATSSVTINGPAVFSYASGDDAIATIEGADYFNPAAAIYNLKVGDIIYCVGSDASAMLQVATVDTSAETITTTAFAASGSVDTANIVDGAVTNAKVNASAAIDFSKLAALTDGHLLVGSGANVAASVAMSGDATIANTGAVTIDENLIQHVQVDVNLASFIGAYTTSVQLVAAPGASKKIILHRANLWIDYGGTVLADGGAVHIQYDSTANGGGTKATGTLAAATLISATADTTFGFSPVDTTLVDSASLNKGLYFAMATQDFTGGTSSAYKFDVWYSVADFS